MEGMFGVWSKERENIGGEFEQGFRGGRTGVYSSRRRF